MRLKIKAAFQPTQICYILLNESFKLRKVLPYMIGQDKCLRAFQGSCKEYLFFYKIKANI